MREPVPNQRHWPSVPSTGVLSLPVLTLALMVLLSCGGSMIIDQSHVDEVRALIEDGWFKQAEERAAELLDDSSPGEGARALARVEVMALHASALRRSDTEKRGEARELAEKALMLKIDMVGRDHPSTADSHYDLGIACMVLNDLESSRRSFEEALRIRRLSLGPGHAATALPLVLLGHLHFYTTFDADVAVAMIEEAAAIQEQALPPDHPDVALRLITRGSIHYLLGEYGQARNLFEEALAIRLARLRPDHPSTADSHESLGLLLQLIGEYSAARRHLEKFLEIQIASTGPDHPSVAAGLLGLANLLFSMDDLDEAERLASRAREICERRLPPGHLRTAAAIKFLADLHGEQGEYEEAGILYQQLLAADRPGNENDQRFLVDVLNRYSGVCLMTGDIEKAVQVNEQALDLARRLYGEDAPDTMFVLHNKAVMLFDTGETEAANTLIEQIVHRLEKNPDYNHLFLLTTLLNQARFLSAMGRDRDALHSALKAERLARQHLRLTARSLEGELALKYASWGVDALHAAVTIAARSPVNEALPLDQVVDAMVRWRALVLDEMANRALAVRESADPRIAALRQDLDMCREELATLAVGDEETGNTPAGGMERAAARKQQAERALAEASESFRRESEERQTGLDDVLRSLPPTGVLVAYLRYRNHGSEEEPANPAFCYLALVISAAHRSHRLIPLGDAAVIDRLVGEWRREILSGPASGIPGLGVDTAYRRAGAALRDAIWDRLKPLPADSGSVFIVPDSAIHLVSFAALPAGNDGYLLEQGPAIHYLSAERELAAWAPGHGGDDDGRDGGLLVLGAPDFGVARDEAPAADILQVPPRDSLGSRYAALNFGPLPRTETEAGLVAGLWEAAGQNDEPDRDGHRPVRKLTGAQATERAFKELAPGSHTIHLATHAYFLQPSAQGESASPPARVQTGHRPFALARPGANPLLYSGLALAGANSRSDAEDDGILTAEEIAALDLAGTRLAVLSACDTGLGTVQSGEGVFGLRRAFRLAGVRTVVTSLWPVEDESAEEWMEHFYIARLNHGTTVLEAARQSGRAILDRRRKAGESTHPFFWAAFVAAGDWR